MAEDNKGGVQFTDSRNRGAGQPVQQVEQARDDNQPHETAREQQKVKVRPLAAFNSPHGFKNHESELFEATRDWAVQARAVGIIEYVDEGEAAKDAEEAAKAASDRAREVHGRRKASGSLAEEHKTKPLQPPPAIKSQG